MGEHQDFIKYNVYESTSLLIMEQY